METIIFFSLGIPIFLFVLYLGGRAIMAGFSAKSSNKSDAEGLIDVSGGFSVDSYELFTEKINWLLDKSNYNNSSKNCKTFVTENSGSTEKILKELYE